MILLLDNRDSFTFNLEHALQTLGAEVRTLRSTELDVLALESCGILIGPGPCPGGPREGACAWGRGYSDRSRASPMC